MSWRRDSWKDEWQAQQHKEQLLTKTADTGLNTYYMPAATWQRYSEEQRRNFLTTNFDNLILHLEKQGKRFSTDGGIKLLRYLNQNMKGTSSVLDVRLTQTWLDVFSRMTQLGLWESDDFVQIEDEPQADITEDEYLYDLAAKANRMSSTELKKFILADADRAKQLEQALVKFPDAGNEKQTVRTDRDEYYESLRAEIGDEKFNELLGIRKLLDAEERGREAGQHGK